jgi:U3 small nucleolar RNA-associated protein 18
MEYKFFENNKSKSIDIPNDQPEEECKWIDEEDEKIQISLNAKNNLRKLKKEKEEDLISGKDFQERLREQFTKMSSGADIYKWAYDQPNSEEDTTESLTGENSLEKLLKTNKNLIDKENDLNAFKDSSILRITQIQDLNKDHYHSSIVTAMNFHPVKENLAFTAGLDKKLKLFTIDSHDDSTSHVQTVNTIDMPISSAKFLNEREIVISGRRKHYFLYNLESNKLDRCNGLFSHHKEVTSLEKLFVGDNHYAFATNEGYILIYDSKNKTYRYDLKISGSVNSVCFDKNGINLYAVGDQSEIYVFDLRKYRHCVNKFSDSGNFNTNFMDLTRDNSYLATGKKIIFNFF